MPKVVLIRIYSIISALIVLNVLLYFFWKMSFAGYWSDRVIFWFWLVLTPVITFSWWRKLWAKIYFWLILAGLILTVIPMAIPFFAIYLSATGKGRLNHFTMKNNFRVQTVGYGVMGRPRILLVKNGLLFDKVLLEEGDEIEKNDSTQLYVRNAKNAKFIKQSDSSITIKYFFEKDTLQTEYILKGKTSFNY